MKTFIVIIAIIGFCSAKPFTNEQIAKAEQITKECMAEVGTNPLAVVSLRSGDFSKNDETMMCFTKCFFQKAGFMDESGNLNEDAIIEKLSIDQPKEKIMGIMNKCKTVKSDNPCETAFKAYECYKKNINTQ